MLILIGELVRWIVMVSPHVVIIITTYRRVLLFFIGDHCDSQRERSVKSEFRY